MRVGIFSETSTGLMMKTPVDAVGNLVPDLDWKPLRLMAAKFSIGTSLAVEISFDEPSPNVVQQGYVKTTTLTSGVLGSRTSRFSRTSVNVHFGWLLPGTASLSLWWLIHIWRWLHKFQ